MTNDSQIKLGVLQYLRESGLAADEIPESDNLIEQRPDIKASHQGQRYVIELKRKLSEAEMVARYQAMLSTGQMVSHHDTTERTNTIAGVVSEAAKQLDAFCDNADIRIVWLDGQGWDPSLQLMQLKASLFGTRQIIDLSDEKDSRECFYFSFSDFLRHRESIDLAVVRAHDKAQLCVNNFSPRYKIAKLSYLRQIFGTAVIDPLEWEEDGSIYLADDCGLDRRNTDAIVEFLKKKYQNPDLIDMEMKSISATMVIPDPPRAQQNHSTDAKSRAAD
ncbi:MAG: hypothetical protein ACUZ8E_16125 [Candidatus Anammoxibacter sp.]